MIYTGILWNDRVAHFNVKIHIHTHKQAFSKFKVEKESRPCARHEDTHLTSAPDGGLVVMLMSVWRK